MPDELTPKEKWGVRELLSSELARAVFICTLLGSFYSMVIIPITEIKNDLRQINENHLKHIEDAITKINDRDDKQDERLESMCSKMDKFFGYYEAKTGEDITK